MADLLVSAIMPTRGRSAWAQQAVDCFLAQTYREKNLYIIDDIDDPSFPDWKCPHSSIQYVAISRLLIYEKRNIAAGLANGELICHWDSDDYSEPGRILDQVRRLEESGKSVTGYHNIFFYDESTERATKYIGDHLYALGTSLMYTKRFWADHPFQPGDPIANAGEDNIFVKEARDRGQLVSVDAGSLMVARIHGDNTSPKDTTKYDFRPVSSDHLPRGFFSCSPVGSRT